MIDLFLGCRCKISLILIATPRRIINKGDAFMPGNKKAVHLNKKTPISDECERIEELLAEISFLNSKFKIHEDSYNALRDIIDTVFIQVALKFGDKTPNGRRVSLPVPNLKTNTYDYFVLAAVSSSDITVDVISKKDFEADF